MQITEKILNVKQNLPHGSLIKISKETGITQKTIGNFFSLKTKFKADTYKKIMSSAEKIISEIK